MFFRKITVSDECMEWLKKFDLSVVKLEEAKGMYVTRCEEIRNEVLRYVYSTIFKEPVSKDDKTIIVIEVKLLKSDLLDIKMVVTNVYAVVYTRNNKRYYVLLNEKMNLKKVSKIDTDSIININVGDYIEFLNTVESKTYQFLL